MLQQPTTHSQASGIRQPLSTHWSGPLPVSWFLWCLNCLSPHFVVTPTLLSDKNLYFPLIWVSCSEPRFHVDFSVACSLYACLAEQLSWLGLPWILMEINDKIIVTFRKKGEWRWKLQKQTEWVGLPILCLQQVAVSRGQATVHFLKMEIVIHIWTHKPRHQSKYWT